MNKEVKVLIISNKYDYSTDYVCLELYKKEISYLRLNRDEFINKKVTFNLEKETLLVNFDNKDYIIKSDLKSVYYRAPTYLRETYLKEYSTESQVYNSQWMSFIRNLTFFENAKWINNPNNIYKAENKILQLKYAKKIGLNIPFTIVTNDNNVNVHNLNSSEFIVIKGIDTVLFKKDDKEAFFYTNVINRDELKKYDLSLAPLILQYYLYPKIDIRVTVIEEKIFAVKIVDKNGNGVKGDWRKLKDNVFFVPIDLPEHISKKLIKLLKLFNLRFAGIDLIYHNNQYYFVELNPTGEWGWLVKKSKLPIDQEIAKCLSAGL